MICSPMHVVFTVYFDLCHANFMPAIRVFCPTEENKTFTHFVLQCSHDEFLIR